MFKIMIILLSCQTIFALKHNTKAYTQFQNARKQYMLEYTTFGVDECLKLHKDKITTKEDGSGRIIIGSEAYFKLLGSCFKHITNRCYGENCIVSRSMSKRLKNVEHVDKQLKKF